MRLGRSMTALHRRAEIAGLSVTERRGRPFGRSQGHDLFGCHNPSHPASHWRPNEVAILELHYGTEPIAATARRVGRTRVAVFKAARRLGLSFELEEAS